MLFQHDERYGRGYSPGARDHAEDARRIVLDALLHVPGQAGLQAKIDLARQPLFATMEDRIRAVARERQAEEADDTRAATDDVAALLAGGELPPHTAAEMASILVDRLDDLQKMMRSDASPRAAWAEVTQENALRPAIAHELVVTARRAYTVDQEAVTADNKETDIRLRSTYDQQATIEQKIGEKDRSGRELRDAIDHQLVPKYMAHRDARTGCLLVTVRDPDKRWKHPDTNDSMDRHQLQSMLSEAAQAAQERLGGEARVMARVLDLTPGLPTEEALTRHGHGDSPSSSRMRSRRPPRTAIKKASTGSR